jgi:hypothetical protein
MFSFVQKRIAFVEALMDLVVHSEDNRTLFPITHVNGILFGLFSTIDYTINTLHPINTFFNLNKIKIDNFIKYNPYTYQVFNENIVAVPYYLIIKIQRAWKKYRYNVFKKRRDPLKRELMEYLYHPSRLSFDPDD